MRKIKVDQYMVLLHVVKMGSCSESDIYIYMHRLYMDVGGLANLTL